MTDSRLDIIDNVRNIMVELFDRDDLIVSDDTTADDVEEWDSLHHIRLIVAIERRYKIRFSPLEIESLKNVGDLVGLIDRKLDL